MTHKVTKPIALDESFRTTEQNPQNIADVLANKLDAIKSAIENGGSDEMEAAFECHYNVTSATDIYNAMQEKKVPFFYQNGVVAQLWKVETNKYTFRTTSTRVVEGENILDIVDYIVNGSVWSTATKTISGGSSSQQAYLAKVESSVNFDTTGLSGMQSIISVNDVPADGVYQLSIFMCITPKTASATKSDLVFQFTGTSGTGMPNTTFHAVVDDSQTFAQQLSFSTTLNLKAGTNTLKMACGGLNTEYLVFVDNLTVAQLVNGVYHNGDNFNEVHTLTQASNFNNDDGVLVDGATGGPRFMLWQTLANKVLGFIKSLSTTITAFRTGDVIAVDGPSGTAKMSKDNLLAIVGDERDVKISEAGVFEVSEVVGYLQKYNGKIASSETSWHSYVTDYIRVNEGDVFVYKGRGDLVACSCAFYDSSKTITSPGSGIQHVVSDGEVEITVPAGAVYARFGSFASTSETPVFTLYKKFSADFFLYKRMSDDENNYSKKTDTEKNIADTGAYAVSLQVGFLRYYDGVFDDTETSWHSYVTDYIRVNEGDVFVYKGRADSAASAAYFYDANKVKIGNYAGVHAVVEDGEIEITVPSGAVYARFASYTGIAYAPIFFLVKKISESYFANLKFNNQCNLLNGKRVCVIGDSIVEQGYVTNGLQNIASCTIINKGKSGCTFAKNTGRTDSLVERFDNGAGSGSNQYPIADDLDVVIVMAGINDYGNAGYYNIPFGSIESAIDNTTFCGAVRYVLEGLKNRYAGKTIILCSMMHSQHFVSGGSYLSGWDEIVEGDDGAFTYKTNAAGHTLPDYKNALKSVAELYGVPFVDMFNCGISAVLMSDRSNYYQDGLHPNSTGGRIAGRYIYNEVGKLNA